MEEAADAMPLLADLWHAGLLPLSRPRRTSEFRSDVRVEKLGSGPAVLFLLHPWTGWLHFCSLGGWLVCNGTANVRVHSIGINLRNSFGDTQPKGEASESRDF